VETGDWRVKKEYESTRIPKDKDIQKILEAKVSPAVR
jgi:hypothetical protein